MRCFLRTAFGTLCLLVAFSVLASSTSYAVTQVSEGYGLEKMNREVENYDQTELMKDKYLRFNENPTVISDGREKYMLSAEELASDTKSLLKIVLNAEYIRIARMNARLLSSNAEALPVRYDEFNGYIELLTRDDLEDALLSYSEGTTEEMFVLHEILQRSDMRQILSSTSLETVETAVRQRILSEVRIVGNPTGGVVLGQIYYRDGGFITMAWGDTLPLLVPERSLDADEIATMNATYVNCSGSGANCSSSCIHLLSSAATEYNCHSYAWYLADYTNQYWITINETAMQNHMPDNLLPISEGDEQPKDIVVYFNQNGKPLHSAIVVSCQGGNIVVQSKWGVYGVYEHEIDTVPSNYMGDDGKTYTCIYRYHHYDQTVILDMGHTGKLHHYDYVDVCDICEYELHTPTVVICPGPPCPETIADTMILKGKEEETE